MASESLVAACTARWIPRSKEPQTAADVEELSHALSALEKRGKLHARTLAPVRRACRKLAQDARYLREIAIGTVRRVART